MSGKGSWEEVLQEMQHDSMAMARLDSLMASEGFDIEALKKSHEAQEMSLKRMLAALHKMEVCMCVYLCICVCVGVCGYSVMHACVYVCMVFMCLCMRACMPVCLCMYACMPVCLECRSVCLPVVCMYVYTCVY